MDNRKAIGILKNVISVCEHDCKNCRLEVDKTEILSTFNNAIKALEKQTTINQIIWERDIAIEQLKDLGYDLGEKTTTTVTIGRIIGKTELWYQCDNCGEYIDKTDCYCKKCGRKLRYD